MNKNTNRFLEIFYTISEIPRESGKEEKFALFLENFAKIHNLECYKDKYNNVLIKKQGNKENNEPLILQAHIDMVCTKTEDSNHNFETEPIEIIQDGDMISAKDTTLGADQGIGIAIILLILESSKIKHPDLECLFTTEEETTFNGAENFDYSILKGKKLINLDHCKDNSFVVGCDGDIGNEYKFKSTKINLDIPTYKIKISNLMGGNSGIQYDKTSENAILILSKIIEILQKENVYICSIRGGTSEGDIATFCEIIIKTEINNLEDKIKEIIKIEKFTNQDIKLLVEKSEEDEAFNLNDSRTIINQIVNLKQGLIEKNDEIITSGNIGFIETIKNEITIKGIVRSLDVDKLNIYNNKNISLSQNNNFKVKQMYRDYAWMPNNNSKLKESYKKTYYKLYRKLSRYRNYT